MSRVFAPSCERNQAPIFTVLQTALQHSTAVLEIGSGSGQHSVYFAPRLAHLVWHTSDAEQHHPSIEAWHAEMPCENLRAPLAFEVGVHNWPCDQAGQPLQVDAVFTSNTLHIMAWPNVVQLMAMVGQYLPAGGVFVVYGPMNYGGRFTSPSNRAFDAWLKEQNAVSGIRDAQVLEQLALTHGLKLEEDHAMPAHNRCLVFRKLQAA